MDRRLSWQILADFGQARDAQNSGNIAELSAKMWPRWRQDGPRWGLSGHLEADWGVILGVSGGLGGDPGRNGRMKMSTTIAFWLHFRILGGLVGCSWGVFWAILFISWALLGDLGHNLGSLERS